MADDNDSPLDSDAVADLDAGNKDAKAPSKLPMIVLGLNLLLTIGVLGTAYYTLVLFNRPVITESTERDRLKDMKDSHKVTDEELTYIKFEQVNANLKPDPSKPPGDEKTDTQILGQIHQAQISFYVQLNSPELKEKAEKYRTRFLDQLLVVLGNKNHHELLTLQGRFRLRAQIVELLNEIADERLVQDVYFTEFIVM